jgi:hypothetical protein
MGVHYDDESPLALADALKYIDTPTLTRALACYNGTSAELEVPADLAAAIATELERRDKYFIQVEEAHRIFFSITRPATDGDGGTIDRTDYTTRLYEAHRPHACILAEPIPADFT